MALPANYSQEITGSGGWYYDPNPADPGADSPYYELWLKQTSGIRTVGTHQVYTHCAKETLLGNIVTGEISKTYWDNH